MMITRCPGCGTAFRVTSDQLKARQGQVRCGRCGNGFNALTELSDGAPAPVAPPVIDPALVAPSEPELPVIEVSEASEVSEAIEVSDATEPADMAGVIEPTEEIEPCQANEAPEEAESGSASEPPEVPEPASESTPEPVPGAMVPAAEPLLHETGQSGRRRWPWIAGSLVALLALVTQLAIHLRTDLATRFPDTKSTLEALCEPLGCEIGLPAKIDMIEIETSDLVPDDKRAGHLLLSATLRNRASHAQAWPNLELTLTDTADRALLRRVLPPTEYLPPQTSVPAGFSARSRHAVRLDLQTADVQAVGYRLYVFYP
jgi:predicted Zn finger-like uncharacterized protein